ncbi:MAG TPA: hypothetical protein VMB52_00195 [Verrucomicrobiae bacterium]|nr:hypothetical protein [Verrucomicrobiae bacterium]
MLSREAGMSSPEARTADNVSKLALTGLIGSVRRLFRETRRYRRFGAGSIAATAALAFIVGVLGGDTGGDKVASPESGFQLVTLEAVAGSGQPYPPGDTYSIQVTDPGGSPEDQQDIVADIPVTEAEVPIGEDSFAIGPGGNSPGQQGDIEPVCETTHMVGHETGVIRLPVPGPSCSSYEYSAVRTDTNLVQTGNSTSVVFDVTSGAPAG